MIFLRTVQRFMMICVLPSILVLSCTLLAIAQGKRNATEIPMHELTDTDLLNIGLELTKGNKGIAVSVNKQPEVDPGAVRVNFDSISGDVARADVIRVVLQSLSKLATYHPTLVEFARSGQERLLLDGKEIADIVFQYDHDKPLPAWRMLAERATKPDGTQIKLPDGVLARTTASFGLVDELIRGTSETSKSSENGSVDSRTENESLKKADKWHPGSPADHGEIVSNILQTARTTPLTIKDGSRLDFGQINRTIISVTEAVGKGVTNARIALQQQEQGGQTEVPPGSSELVGLQLRFGEIFAVTDDDLLMPVTPALAALAPESTFAGVTVYGKHREVKTRITGKAKVWQSGISAYSVGESHYDTLFQTDKGPMRPVMNEVLLRWGDIKDKMALDFSDKKLQEDFDMERQALSESN
jgi:hypothetical protein